MSTEFSWHEIAITYLLRLIKILVRLSWGQIGWFDNYKLSSCVLHLFPFNIRCLQSAFGGLDVRPARNALIAMWGQSNDLIYIPMLAPTKCTLHGRRVFDVHLFRSFHTSPSPSFPQSQIPNPKSKDLLIPQSCFFPHPLILPSSQLPSFPPSLRGVGTMAPMASGS